MPSTPDVSDVGSCSVCYDEHPAFKTSEPPWQVDQSRLETFDVIYREISTQPVSPSGARQKHQQLVQLIDEIFEGLEEQASASHEALFLKELSARTKALLERETAHYAAVKREPGSQSRLSRDKHFFMSLSAPAVEELTAIAETEVRIFRERAAEGKLERDDLSANGGESVNNTVARLQEEYTDQGVLDEVSEYMGYPFRVGGTAIELSTPSANWWGGIFDELPPPDSLYAHFDEAKGIPKSIVYLSEVDESTGPTSCYPGIYEQLPLNALQDLIGRIILTLHLNNELKQYYDNVKNRSLMMSGRFRNHFMRLPEQLRFNSHFGWDVIPGSALDHTLVRAEHKMLGPAGTAIVFDGAKLLHRGGLITHGERIALQVIFTPRPTFIQRVYSFATRKIQAVTGHNNA